MRHEGGHLSGASATLTRSLSFAGVAFVFLIWTVLQSLRVCAILHDSWNCIAKLVSGERLMPPQANSTELNREDIADLMMEIKSLRMEMASLRHGCTIRWIWRSLGYLGTGFEYPSFPNVWVSLWEIQRLGTGKRDHYGKFQTISELTEGALLT